MITPIPEPSLVFMFYLFHSIKGEYLYFSGKPSVVVFTSKLIDGIIEKGVLERRVLGWVLLYVLHVAWLQPRRMHPLCSSFSLSEPPVRVL
nr:hypothetical protein [Tanacetum cinerariifolium]